MSPCVALVLAVGSAGAACAAATVSDVQPIDPPAAAGAMAPALVASGGDLLLTWLEPGPGAGHRLRFARWRAGAWGAPVDLPTGDDLFVNWADTPEIAVAGNGDLIVAWLARRAGGKHDYDVELARSTDGGTSFTRLGRLNDDGVAAEHGFVSFAPEGEGVRVFWLDGRATPAGGAMGLRTARVAGTTIGASESVDERVCDCCSTAAVAGARGAAVAFRDRDEGEVRDVRLALRRPTGETESLAVGADGWRIEGCPVNGPALASDGSDLWVAWFTAAEGRARVQWQRSADGGESLGAPQILDAEAPAGRLALAALGGGEAAVGWIGERDGGGELRLARLSGSATAGKPRSLAAVALGRTSGRPRLARQGERIAVAWTEGERPGETRLRVALLPTSALSAP